MGGHNNVSESAPVILPLTQDDQILQSIATNFARRQADTLENVIGLERDISSALGRTDLIGRTIESIREDPQFINEELVRDVEQAERDRLAGGGISEQQRASIQGAADAALGLATSDIEDFATSQRESLIRDVTPGRGLRPTDTPILDRGFQIASEATRQAGQAARDIRGRAFEAELSLPLQTSAANLATLDTAARLGQLRGQLANESFNRRLTAIGGASDLGLQISQPGPITGTLTAVKQPKVAGTETRSTQRGGGVLAS